MTEILGLADQREESEIESVIVAAVEKHARGEIPALARDHRGAACRWSGDPAHRRDPDTQSEVLNAGSVIVLDYGPILAASPDSLVFAVLAKSPTSVIFSSSATSFG